MVVGTRSRGKTRQNKTRQVWKLRSCRRVGMSQTQTFHFPPFACPHAHFTFRASHAFLTVPHTTHHIFSCLTCLSPTHAPAYL